MKLTFDDVVSFHGHACPGLAVGYRVTALALKEMGKRAEDEELVAVVENNSCAVDAIQAMAGCTFGKGNLIFKDYGKQVYTFLARPSGKSIRIAVVWEPPLAEAESKEESVMWERFSKGERSEKVMRVVQARKARKMQLILGADDNELFEIRHTTGTLPQRAQIYPSFRCETCGEKVMEPRTRKVGDKKVCIPCAEN